MHCSISLANQKQSVVSWREFAICCAHVLCSLAYCFSHCALDFVFFQFLFSGDSCASFGFRLLSWMPRLTNNSLASCSGTDLSLSPVTSDVISSASSSLATAGLVPSSSGLASTTSSLLPVVLPSVSSASSALPSLVVTSLGTTLWSASVPLVSPSLASRTWLPVPYLPQNPWPTSSVVPTTASSAINGGVVANFTFPFSSSSANFQPPFCSLPVSSGVAHPAPCLNPILQQASTSQNRCRSNSCQIFRQLQVWLHQVCFCLWLIRSLLLSLLALGFSRSLVRR